MRHRALDPDEVASTIEKLCLRVETRFPGSGLARVCRELEGIARRAAQTTAWIARPILALRVSIGLLVALLLAGLALSVASLRLRLTPRFGDLTMKRLAILALVLITAVASFAAGAWLAGRTSRQGSPGGERRILHWVDPMNPALISEKPGIGVDIDVEALRRYAVKDVPFFM